METQLTRLYDKDYLPFRPLLTENSQQKYASKFIGAAQSQYRVEYDEDLTEFIADDIFAALLNHEGLIQFGDSIYKYTPYGLFMVKEPDLEYLNTFLDNLTNGTSGLRTTDFIDPCFALQPYNLEPGQINSIDGNINYFAAQDICLPPGDWDNPLPNPGTGSGGNISTDRGIQYAANLQPCLVKNNSVFGETFRCEVDFSTSNTSRVVTKAFRQNYLVTRSIGQEVKHQTRTVLWFQSSVDELRNGLNHIYFEFKTPKGVQPPNDNIASGIEARLVHNGQIYDYISNSFSPPRWEPCAIVSPNCGSVDMSELHNFYNAEINTVLFIRYGNDNYENNMKRNKFFQDILPQEVEKLKVFSGTLGINYDDLPLLIVQLGKDIVSVYYKTYSERERNTGKLESVYMRDSYFKISASQKGTDPWKLKGFEMKGGTFQNSKFDIYGIARKNSVWKGSRIIASE